MHHILYETTNLLSGKKYIGVHSTKNKEDGYLGSGVLLTKAIKKYGKSNFSRKVIAEYQTREDLLKAESETVTSEIVNSGQYYNVSLGGRSYIDSLIDLQDANKLKEHQSKAGRLSGLAFLSSLSEQEKKQWHSKGGKSSRNSGGYSMTDEGKNNIKNARKNSQKYKCPLCESKHMDGGNFNKHMNTKHQIPKTECHQWRAGAKVDS